MRQGSYVRQIRRLLRTDGFGRYTQIPDRLKRPLTT